MSTVEYVPISTLSKIPLGRRIAELMEELGEGLSIRSFAERIGMNRESLRLMLLGERRIAPSELEQIANGLGISASRLKQEDLLAKEQELIALVMGKRRTKVMLTRARSIAAEVVQLAMGKTERGLALNNLGKVQFLQEQYEEAHRTWLSAFEYAKSVEAEYGDKQLLHLVTINMMQSHTIRKEYSNFEELLEFVEAAYAQDPNKLGITYYVRMKMEEERGNLEQAKKYAYRSLEEFERTKDGKQIGTALINVAHYEYFLRNYKTAIRALTAAINIAQPFEDTLILAVKEYVKSLMQVRDYPNAIKMVDKYAELAKEYPEYRAKMQIMYTVAKDDPSFAESVLNDTGLSMKVRHYASKCLMEYHYLKGDAVTSMKFYEMKRIFSNTKSEYLYEEEF
ncbi:helix-turn-helix domain-containing protein [Tumebacillus lipolyticus]|uniref:Helix-turn-helix domain-containing protein n=1 Tax=Tumebacillus lipolyticus TaxID=1280370 RepID=A0ABW4ZXH3_9BACL